MIVPNQYFDVKITRGNRKHYRQMGYSEVNVGDVINVPLEHLNKANESRILLQCDICGEIYDTSYRNLKKAKYPERNYCKHCSMRGYMKDKYGTPNSMDLDWVVEKTREIKTERYGGWYSSEMAEKQKQTKIERYGEDYVQQAKEKAKQTCLEKYGVEYAMQSEDISSKQKQTCFKKYGVENISQANEVKEKKKKTYMEHYGVEYPSQSFEIQEKMKQTYVANDNVPTSSQQVAVYNMLKNYSDNADTKLNYQFRSFVFDTALFLDNGIKIDVEYDGYHWHQDAQKDRRRDEVSKSYGWKILRIKGGHKLPTEEQLIEAIDKLVGGYSYTQIVLDDWKEVEKA